MKNFPFIAILVVASWPACAQGPAKQTLLPSKFIQGERFYLKLAAPSGDTLQAFCDTGGGFTAVYQQVIDAQKLTSKVKEKDNVRYIEFRDLVKDERIPPIVPNVMVPVSTPAFVIPGKEIMQGEGGLFLMKVPQDAFLGQFFFMNKAWTIDYPKRKVWVNTPLKPGDPGVQRVGFKKDDKGKKLFGHPSVMIEVDGETLDVLFDTGASFILSDEGRKGLNTDAITMGGSFISRTIFEKWKSKHPDWRIIEKGDWKFDMIEVPQVTIGGNTVGPVLFSLRPDEVWSAGMIQSMDKIVQGAIGGSAFKYLKVTIDYNGELARFEKD